MSFVKFITLKRLSTFLNVVSCIIKYIVIFFPFILIIFNLPLDNRIVKYYIGYMAPEV